MPTTRTYNPSLPKFPVENTFCANPYVLRAPDPHPHTYGVRLGPWGSFATEPCRPTACISLARHSATHSVKRSHGLPQSCGGTSSDHCSLITAHYRYASPDGDGWAYEISVTHFLAQSPTDYYLLFTDHSEVYCADNLVKFVDPNGEEIGWVEKADGTIYWDENAHDQKTTKKGDTYLGEEGQRSVGTTVLNYHSDGTYNEQETVLIVDWGEDISTEYVRNNKTFKEREADFTNKSADFLQGLYIFLVSPINDLVVLTTSHDLYGNQVTKEDKTWSAIGIATFGSGKTLKILRLSDKVKKTKKIERGVEAVGTGLDIKTGSETYKKNNKRRNNYEKK